MNVFCRNQTHTVFHLIFISLGDTNRADFNFKKTNLDNHHLVDALLLVDQMTGLVDQRHQLVDARRPIVKYIGGRLLCGEVNHTGRTINLHRQRATVHQPG